jgi:hypothetical protein
MIGGRGEVGVPQEGPAERHGGSRRSRPATSTSGWNARSLSCRPGRMVALGAIGLTDLATRIDSARRTQRMR